MATTMKSSTPLGQVTSYTGQYDAGLLYPIAREESRRNIFGGDVLPFSGEDRWTAYEVSWLDKQGKPHLRLAEFVFNCEAPHIVESKSFKLYLNSFNQTHFESESAVLHTMKQDLAGATGGDVNVVFYSLNDKEALSIDSFPGYCIDDCSIDIRDYHPKPQLLVIDNEQSVKNEILYSHLLKTNCPVTDQPDWATVFIEYTGKKIQPESLLAYLVSFREHQDFHENCVESIFCDLYRTGQLDQLTVYARYTRRGGLDINPLRSNYDQQSCHLIGSRLRTSRQ